MNNAHYDTLIKSNALDSDLARRIEVRRASSRLVSPHGFLTTSLTASPVVSRTGLQAGGRELPIDVTVFQVCVCGPCSRGGSERE